MDKKLLIGGIIAASAALIPFNTYAEGVQEITDCTNGAELSAEITEIKLNCADKTAVISNTITLTRDLVIDLNGHTITSNNTYPALRTGTHKLTIKDSAGNGSITTSNFYTVMIDAEGEFTLESGTLKASKGWNINNAGKMTQNGGTIETNGVVVENTGSFTMNGGEIISTSDGNDSALRNRKDASSVINGGTIKSGITGIMLYENASLEFNDGTVEATHFAIATQGGNSSTNSLMNSINAKIEVNGGTITSTGAHAIYLPNQDGKTTINGGTLTSKTGSAIEIRAGSLNITGGTFTSEAGTYTVEPNGSGTTTGGSAIAIAQHTTQLPIDVTICGGTFNAVTPFSEDNPQDNDEDSIAKITAKINADCGTVTMNATGENAIVAKDLSGFVYGGQYNPDIDEEYLGEGIIRRKNGEGYLVGTEEFFKNLDIENAETLDNIVKTTGIIALSLAGIFVVAKTAKKN